MTSVFAISSMCSALARLWIAGLNLHIVVLQEKGHALKKSLAELAIAANQLALKKRTQEVDDGR